MPNILITRRNLQGISLLLLSILALFLSRHKGALSTDQSSILKVPRRDVNTITFPINHEINALDFRSHSRHIGRFDRRAAEKELPNNDGDTAYEKAHTGKRSHAFIDFYHEERQLEWQSSNSSLVKRDAAEIYDKAKCTGGKMWPKIQSAMAGHEPAGEEFNISALDNGWSRSKDIKLGLDSRWREYIDKELGPNKIPPEDQISFIEFDQFKSFQNRKGQEAPATTGSRGWAKYYGYYVPTISTIVISNMVSPMYIFKKNMKTGQTMPSNEDIKDQHIPPLSRWSDVAWVVYSQLCAKTPGSDPKKLQIIGHDTVIGSDTTDVVNFIMARYYKGPSTAVIPFPGLEFGMDKEEGLALLGTPNGMGTGWLMYDRAEDLGRRDLKVRIWHPDISGTRIMMAMNMAPI